MTGLAVLGAGLQPLPLSAEQLAANPCDLNDLPEYTDDDRTLDKLGYYCVDIVLVQSYTHKAKGKVYDSGYTAVDVQCTNTGILMHHSGT